MSYNINCKKCGTLFMKVAHKSTETVCHGCRRRTRNAMVPHAFEEMSKAEIIRLLEIMRTKHEEMETKITSINSKMDNLLSTIGNSKVIKEAVIKAAEEINTDMKMLYIKHNNRILKLEKEVFKLDNANTVSKE